MSAGSTPPSPPSTASRQVAPARTLLVTNDMLPQVGGIQQYTDNIARRLPGASVFAAAHPEADSHDRRAPYEVIRGPRRYLLPTAETRRALAGAIRKTGAEVLLFMTPWPLVGLGARLGMPTAVCTHGAELIMPARLPLLRTALRRQLRGADLLFAVSKHTAGHVRTLVGAQGPQVRPLPTGVPLETFTPQADGAHVRARHGLGDDPVVVCVGRLIKRKGQDMLVRAWPAVRVAIPDARLLLVGTGPLHRRLRRAASRLAPGAVVLAGRVPWEELADHHAAGDVFAHPNRTRLWGLETEGFGVIFLEAQAVGRPVIAGDSGGAPEALQPGISGLVVDGTSVADVATAVIELLGNPDRAATMGAAGLDFVGQRFGWTQIIDELDGDLTALRDGHANPARGAA